VAGFTPAVEQWREYAEQIESEKERLEAIERERRRRVREHQEAKHVGEWKLQYELEPERFGTRCVACGARGAVNAC